MIHCGHSKSSASPWRLSPPPETIVMGASVQRSKPCLQVLDRQRSEWHACLVPRDGAVERRSCTVPWTLWAAGPDPQRL